MGLAHKNMKNTTLLEDLLYDCDSKNGTLYHITNPSQKALEEKANQIIDFVRSMILTKPKLATHKYYMANIKLTDMTPAEMQVLNDCTDEIIEVLVKHSKRLPKHNVKNLTHKNYVQRESNAKMERTQQMQQQGINCY